MLVLVNFWCSVQPKLNGLNVSFDSRCCVLAVSVYFAAPRPRSHPLGRCFCHGGITRLLDLVTDVWIRLYCGSGTKIKTRKRNIAVKLDPSSFSDAIVAIYNDYDGDRVSQASPLPIALIQIDSGVLTLKAAADFRSISPRISTRQSLTSPDMAKLSSR